MRIASAVVALFGAAIVHAAEPAATIVEFFNAPANKYFISANPADWALLDQYANIGWARTGVTFSAFTQGQDAAAQPVCRFFAPSVASHFFSVSKAECDLLAVTAGFVNEGIAWYALPPAAGACAAGATSLYRTFNNGNNGPANHRYFTDYSFYQSYASKGYALEGLSMCLPQSTAEKRLDVTRLLKQGSFGPTPAEIDRVATLGTDAWLSEQFAATASQYTPRAYTPQTRPDTCVNDTTLPITATSYCQRDNYSLFPTQIEFYKQAINGNDQLRQRVAWALSQFFVISATDVSLPYGMGDYQQMLRDNAFTNFRTLLEKVSLHPAMGRFLDMANNRKSTTTGVSPNENYAREILQLFSSGVNLLNDDGTEKKGLDGLPIEAYTQDEIKGFAKVFTGWTYPTLAGATPSTGANPSNLAGTMEPREIYHDVGSKDLLGSAVAPAGTTAFADLTGALDNVFAFANVPPFVAKFMIQKLVTGQPSPSYVRRVANVFKNNGSGVRGDMKAVITAILTDIEARGAAKYEPTYGHLNEPVLMITNLARALTAKTDGYAFYNSGNAMAQPIFSAPSVFNYYSPDHVISSAGVTSPEFGIFNSTTALARINFAQTALYGAIPVSTALYGATGTQFDWTSYTSIAADSNALLNRVNEVMFSGKLTAGTRAVMKTAIDAVPVSDPTGRARAALYLSIAAPEAQIVR
ncbi:MAG: DUF1800 domain-containing protein [Rhizobacter sp.]|nr:DUF1800 domain-containing protein [Burkholderiales bacterium]